MMGSRPEARKRRLEVAENDQTWEGVLIYEIEARFESTSDRPKHIDPDEQGGWLRQTIEDAIKSIASQAQAQIGGVRYAGSRGSKRYG
jgi:hypothetical protein